MDSIQRKKEVRWYVVYLANCTIAEIRTTPWRGFERKADAIARVVKLVAERGPDFFADGEVTAGEIAEELEATNRFERQTRDGYMATWAIGEATISIKG